MQILSREKSDGNVSFKNFVVKDDNGGAAIAFGKNQSELQTEVNKTLKKLKDEDKISKYVTDANELAGEQ